MANFFFYKYHFENTKELLLFSKEGGEEFSNEYLNKRFLEDLSDKFENASHRELNLYDVRDDGTPEIFANEIKRCEDGVVFLEVHNNKHKYIMPKDKTESQEVEHYPFCWVIIDTRPESQAILVQQKKEAFKDADYLVKLITEYFSRELDLKGFGWAFQYQKRYCDGNIWDIVKTRTNKGQDRVKSLCVKFIEKVANVNNAVDVALQTIMGTFAAQEGELKLMSDDAAKKILDDSSETIRNTVDMLITNKYRMKIGFANSGFVEFGKDTEAIYGITDEECKEFAKGDTLFKDSGMMSCLDTIVPETTEHVYMELQKSKRNGRRSRKSY